MASNEALPTDLGTSLQRHMDRVGDSSVERATELAGAQKPPRQVDIIHIAKAAEEYAPGIRLPVAEPKEKRRLEQAMSSLPIVSTILTVVFGGLGLVAILNGVSDKIGGQAYLDIAKIFA